MIPSDLTPDLARAVAFHGHFCPGLLIGYRAAKAAARVLKVGSSEDEELVAVVENNSCSVDAFQALLSTTFGKGNLVYRDNGKQVFTLIDRKANRAVRVAFAGDRFRAKKPDGSSDREAFMTALLQKPDQELFNIREVKAEPPAEAVIEETLTCASCGEGVQASRSLKSDGSILCRPCAAERGL